MDAPPPYTTSSKRHQSPEDHHHRNHNNNNHNQNHNYAAFSSGPHRQRQRGGMDAPPPYTASSKRHQSPEDHHHRNHNNNNHNQNHNYAAFSSGPHRRNLPPLTLSPDQTALRILCHVAVTGGVIGRSGAIVKQLERDTGARIRVDDPVLDCDERLVTVVGSELCDRHVTLCGVGNEDVDVECELSQAQDALLRVYDRVLEVEARMEIGGAGVMGCCRLVAANGQIGAVMGKGGKTIEKMKKETGAKIRILSPEQAPTCTSPGDELIQITGGILAVKKAVVAVSCCLQDCSPSDKVPLLGNRPLEVAPYGDFPGSNAEFLPNYNSSLPPFPGNSVDYASSSPSLSTDADRITSVDARSEQHEVIFRLLCYNGAVGGVIGKGGAIVKALQNETGASINVAASVAGSDERIVTISSFENPDSLYSPTQNAVVRVFTRSLEASIENGLISGLSTGAIVTAKLLVTSSQVGCLIGKEGMVVSEIKKTTGAEVQILGAEWVPYCASENDEVVQITGEHENVENALFHVTGRLKDNLFNSKLLNDEGVGPKSSSSSVIPGVNAYGRARETSSAVFSQSMGISTYYDQDTTLIQGMNRLGFSNKTIGRGNLTALKDYQRGFTTFKGGLELDSESNSAIVANSIVEILVSTHVFGCVYGKDGSNLGRLRQISGANVVVNDPYPGECNGKVIISGTPDQTRAAQSLLQAFILTG